jgi:hypothetical protein
MPKTQRQFIVRWTGYDESYDEWLDWNSLKNVEALHKYLRLNKLVKHIPKSNQLLEDKPVSRRKLQVDEITVANNTNTSIDKRVVKRRNRSSKNRNSKKRARRDAA